ncbi:MAG: multiprotein bridging factor aMBF1 [Thermoproteota archaeon]|jgi:putative transcription factor|nr:multiprotein bridging factor aMBF1 [Thermoproteota archaeon]
MSYCELCGRQTLEKKMVIADGTVFNVCVACSKHGKPYVPPQVATRKKKPPLASKPQKKIGLADETILTPNFATRIREARMKMGLTHEQLGMKMNEKAQLLKKFETGSLKPDEILAKKLERHLGIKLYVTADSDEE